MERIIKYLRSRNLVPILILYFSVGLAGMIVPATRGIFQSLTPFSLLASLALLLIHHGKFSARFWLVSFLIFLAGIAVEIAGVSTGLLFGEYSYGNTLGPKIFHTPVMIGVNWFLLVYSTLSIVDRYIETPYFRAVAAAVLMVVYDFALEPAAIQLDMWTWAGGAVPLQNYLAWFIIAFIFNYVGGRAGTFDRANKLALPLFFIQLGFFVALDLWIYFSAIWDFS
jgi:putative membrane protein